MRLRDLDPRPSRLSLATLITSFYQPLLPATWPGHIGYAEYLSEFDAMMLGTHIRSQAHFSTPDDCLCLRVGHNEQSGWLGG